MICKKITDWFSSIADGQQAKTCWSAQNRPNLSLACQINRLFDHFDGFDSFHLINSNLELSPFFMRGQLPNTLRFAVATLGYKNLSST